VLFLDTRWAPALVERTHSATVKLRPANSSGSPSAVDTKSFKPSKFKRPTNAAVGGEERPVAQGAVEAVAAGILRGAAAAIIELPPAHRIIPAPKDRGP
jgi:hypothetical protein